MLAINIVLLILVIHYYRKSKRCTFTKLLNKTQFNYDTKHRMRRKDDMIILIDIDKFKQINDAFGHAHGDRVIEHVSKTIRSNIRFTDKAYRIGGDEFAILTDDCSIAQRIKDKLIEVPVSMGCGKTYEEADAHMYKCKKDVK